MSTEGISPLHQRMIEDMSSRKLGVHTRGATSTAASGFAAKAVPRHGHG
jgi:hypothetical protein